MPCAAAVAVGLLVLAVYLLLSVDGALGTSRIAKGGSRPDAFTTILGILLLGGEFGPAFRGLRQMDVVPAGTLALCAAHRTVAGLASLAVPGIQQMFGGPPRRTLAHWVGFVLVGIKLATGVLGSSVAVFAALLAAALAIRLGSAIDAFSVTGPAPARRRGHDRWYPALAVVINRGLATPLQARRRGGR